MSVFVLLLFLPVVSAAHPFHTSIAEIEWNAESSSFEVAMRMSSLELERAVAASGLGRINLDRPETSEEIVRQYLDRNFAISASGQADSDQTGCKMQWVGMELEKLDIWTYFEMTAPGVCPGRIEIHPAATVGRKDVDQNRAGCPTQVMIRNAVLTDRNPLQVNFVNLTIAGESESAHFTSDQPEATLTFRRDAPLQNRQTQEMKETGFPAPQGMRRDLMIRFDGENSQADWEPTDKSAWTVNSSTGNPLYELTKKNSDFKPEFRSPFNRSLLVDREFSSFVLDVRVRSTIPDYNHRDLCIFFGYQDDAHLYYVHLGKKTDDHANQIFIVNEAPRTKISTKTTDGIPWDDEWHNVRVRRDADTGTIEVYFDDMTNPVMTATDRTFQNGRVGIGSFDDTGQFDDFSVWIPATD